MKLRVNLYVQALRPVKEKVSLNLVLLSTLGLAALLWCSAVVLQLQTDAKKAQLGQLQLQVQAQEQKIAQLQQSIAQREPAAALVKQHAELTAIIAQKQKLLQFVQGEQRKTSVKYAPVFSYLAAIDPQGFWLDSFSLNATSSQFSGYVTAPEVLPQWLTLLSNASFFKGHTFSQFEMKQEEHTEALAFKVTSAAAVEVKP